MDEIKIEDIKAVKSLEKHILAMFDALRSESLSSEEYPVLLFLISLYKDGIITTDPRDNDFQLFFNLRYIIEITPNTQQYLLVYNVFESTIKRFSPGGFVKLIHIIISIDKNILLEYFPQIFDNILYRITESKGRHGGESIQPVELTRFICQLADLPVKARVFNPFAGVASFATYLDKGHEYFGQELNKQTWALGTLRIMAYERSGSTKYIRDDSILHWPAPSEKFDLIVSNPPYGLRLGNHYREIEPRIRTVEQFLIEKGIHSLTNDGVLIALLPQGFLFRGMEERRLRQILVEEDILDTVISLPSGLLSNIGIPLVILVINKKKQTPGKVRFVQADKYVNIKSSREKALNDIALNDLIHGRVVDKDALTIVENTQIREWDYNLSVPRYFQREIVIADDDKLVQLNDILEYVRGQRGNLPETGKLVRIRDLRDDRVDFQLKVSEIENSELRRPDLHQINETCLLLAIRWQTGKSAQTDPLFPL